MFNGNIVHGGGVVDTRSRRRGTRVSPILANFGDRNASRSFTAAKAKRIQIASAAQDEARVVKMIKVEREDGPISARGDSDSLLSIYMREAGQVKLLTPAEEIELARQIQRGDAAARERMIHANLRLVIKIAREYENLGMPLLDLINEGNLGLMRAVEKFDPTKGSKFSTYSALWIRQQIRRALASQGKTIRLPIHVADRIYHLTQAEVRLRAQLGRDATDEELAQDLKTTVKRLTKLRRAALRPASLDAPLGDDSTNTVADVVADESAITPFEHLRNHTESALVRGLINQLPQREAHILRLRFGLDTGQEQTLETVGRRLKLTRERIRQLQNSALQKLRQMLENPKCFPVAI